MIDVWVRDEFASSLAVAAAAVVASKRDAGSLLLVVLLWVLVVVVEGTSMEWLLMLLTKEAATAADKSLGRSCWFCDVFDADLVGAVTHDMDENEPARDATESLLLLLTPRWARDEDAVEDDRVEVESNSLNKPPSSAVFVAFKSSTITDDDASRKDIWVAVPKEKRKQFFFFFFYFLLLSQPPNF